MHLLEDFRYNNLGSTTLEFVHNPNHKVYLSYERYVTNAFYFTLNDVINLENSKLQALHSGGQTHSSISYWFLSLESYVNTLIKIGCYKNKLDFSAYKLQDLGKRVGSLLSIFKLDKAKFNQNNLLGKVNEFCQFRNELFHDRHFGNSLKFKNTMFSAVPFFCNQVDTFQSVLIFLELTQNLRYAIEGLDTMPSTVIKNAEFAVFEKLDLCYNHILKPSFEAAMQKHGVKTNLLLSLPKAQNLYSTLIKKGEIKSLIQVEQENNFFIQTNEEQTNLSQNLYNLFLSRYVYLPDTFRVAKIMI